MEGQHRRMLINTYLINLTSIYNFLDRKKFMEIKLCRHPDCENPGPKPITEFHKMYKRANNTQGYRSFCKDCRRKINKKNWNEKNAEMKQQNKINYLKHKDKRNLSCKLYYQENRKKILNHKKNNQASTNRYHRERYKSDPEYRCKTIARSFVYRCLNLKKKNKLSFDILGYTGKQLKLHLESQFDDKMTWNNHGNYWSIDHIIAVANFTFINKDGIINYDEIKKCNSLENLRPLECKANISKGSKMLADI